MFIYYLMLFIAAILIAVSVVLDKYYQKSVVGLNIVECAIRKSIPGSIISAIVFFIISKFHIEFSWFSFWMGMILTLINILSTIVCFKAYDKGNISLFTMFRMQGGMLLPYVYGIIFADNKPSIFQIIGIFIMVISLVIPYFPKKNSEKKTVSIYVLLCVIIFFLNGGISIVSYIQSNSSLAVDSNSFLTIYQLQNVVAFTVIYAFWCLIHKEDNLIKNPPKRPKKQTILLLLCILAIGLIGAIGYVLQLVGASHLPAVVTYPMVTGGTVVLTALTGLIFFKEKLDVKGYIGIITTFIATLLFVF